MSKFKKILLCTLAVVLTVAVSAGTAILVNRNDNLPASAEIKNGLSAYELAVQNGFNGTLQEWLDSLKGGSAYSAAVAGGFTGSEEEYNKQLNAFASGSTVNIKTAHFSENG